ncbi:hypothetical protein KUTeg_000573 [Tegillarca granosa]|uniref:Uncharacterized protein n=1 Tax=Tegillarca granosa TaxID=220873 RepID=A0ABQ9FXW8_TEGGR|nr:hypothetical protein KUTeg_000573 [Tegillarca granosa]
MDGDWVTEREGDEGFADCDSLDDVPVPMETNPQAAEAEDEVLNGPKATVYYTFQQNAEEEEVDEEKGKDYTKDEVEELMKSDAYQRKIDTCHFTADCRECGGYPLTRPCPLCDGQCTTVWQRNVKLSHSVHEAHWDGKCKLPPDVQQALMLRKLADSSEQTLTEGMQDLSTR